MSRLTVFASSDERVVLTMLSAELNYFHTRLHTSGTFC